MEIKIKRTIAILLAVCFLVSLTALAVDAGTPNKPVAAFSSTPSGSSSNEIESINIWVGTGGVADSTVKNPVHKY